MLMSANGISNLPTKEDRQLAKLALAQTKRQAVGTNGYRERNDFDITTLPTRYVGNISTRNDNPDGLLPGRPWGVDPPVPDLQGQPIGITLIFTHP